MMRAPRSTAYRIPTAIRPGLADAHGHHAAPPAVAGHPDPVVTTRRDHARDAGAVAVGVFRLEVAAHEVVARDEGALEIGKAVGAGVHRRDDDARVPGCRLPHLWEADLACAELFGPDGVVRLDRSARAPTQSERHQPEQQYPFHRPECMTAAAGRKPFHENLFSPISNTICGWVFHCSQAAFPGPKPTRATLAPRGAKV